MREPKRRVPQDPRNLVFVPVPGALSYNAVLRNVVRDTMMEPYDLERHGEDGFIYLWVADPESLTGVRKVPFRYPKRKPVTIRYVVISQEERILKMTLFAMLAGLIYFLLALLLHAV